jgi:hypothetical protein
MTRTETQARYRQGGIMAVGLTAGRYSGQGRVVISPGLI